VKAYCLAQKLHIGKDHPNVYAYPDRIIVHTYHRFHEQVWCLRHASEAIAAVYWSLVHLSVFYSQVLSAHKIEYDQKDVNRGTDDISGVARIWCEEA